MKLSGREKDRSFSRESAANGETRSFHAASLPVLARQDRPRLVLGTATNRRSAPEQRPVPRSTNIQELRLALRSVRLGCSGTTAQSPLPRWTRLRSASCRTHLRFVLLRVCSDTRGSFARRSCDLAKLIVAPTVSGPVRLLLPVTRGLPCCG